MSSIRYKVLTVVHNSEENIKILIDLLHRDIANYSKLGDISNVNQNEISEYFNRIFMGAEEIKQEIKRARQQANF